MSNSPSPERRYVVWYEGDADREDREFKTEAAAMRFARRIPRRSPILDVIEDGHLVASLSL